MPHDIQIVVDAADPHAQADWWAETLEWEVEPSDEALIKDMLAKGFATEADTKVHHGTLVWRTGAAIRHPENRRRILFVAVPEAKAVKNRVHLDVFVGAENRAAAHEALLSRGATFLWRGQEGPHHEWITMADPEGNEFCVN